ncbi:hypothetical protein B0H12DRAFT_1026063, partial [Mycena haematopus]
MGKAEYSDFDSLFDLSPPASLDPFLYNYYLSSRPTLDTIPITPWTERLLNNISPPRNVASTDARKAPVKTKRYKPVDRKVKPVPTTQPDLTANYFHPIPLTTPTDLPTHPPDYRTLTFGQRVTFPRLEKMLARIQPDILSKDETNLLAFIAVTRESAFAFEYAEKGSFSRQYFPDYVYPTIEHIPWQRKPIPIPLALIEDVRKVILDDERSGRFETTISSYRCAMFPVMKKPG